MKATDEFEYLWQDSERFKRPEKMAAPVYIEHLMAWVQSSIDDEQTFPSKIGNETPVLLCLQEEESRPLTSLGLRGPLSEDLPRSHPSALQATIPSLRPHLLSSLRRHRPAWARTPSEHEFQALCALH